jgi:hypothetical protein
MIFESIVRMTNIYRSGILVNKIKIMVQFS